MLGGVLFVRLYHQFKASALNAVGWSCQATKAQAHVLKLIEADAPVPDLEGKSSASVLSSLELVVVRWLVVFHQRGLPQSSATLAIC